MGWTSPLQGWRTPFELEVDGRIENAAVRSRQFWWRAPLLLGLYIWLRPGGRIRARDNHVDVQPTAPTLIGTVEQIGDRVRIVGVLRWTQLKLCSVFPLLFTMVALVATAFALRDEGASGLWFLVLASVGVGLSLWSSATEGRERVDEEAALVEELRAVFADSSTPVLG